MLGSVIRELIAPVVRECPPECGIVTITDVQVSKDFQNATVFVSSLREPIRECFLLSRRDKLTYSQIADVMGVSVKTIEARMGAALKELRAKLAEWI